MSTIQGRNVWSINEEPLDSKYEKCRNITEEIYKRINITFEIKKLEGNQSDLSYNSDQLDSNELSNETDLFACDKTDSIPSSTEADRAKATWDKYININNNEEKKKPVAYKRPKKRFRKRVKKRQSTHVETDGSSDEALPLSRMIELDTKCLQSDSPDHVMGVPNIIIITKDLKQRLSDSSDRNINRSDAIKSDQLIEATDTVNITQMDNNTADLSSIKEKKVGSEWKSCSVCNLSFRGDRGLRRHTSMSHLSPQMSKREQRAVKL